MFMTSMRETSPGDDIVVQQVQHAQLTCQAGSRGSSEKMLDRVSGKTSEAADEQLVGR